MIFKKNNYQRHTTDENTPIKKMTKTPRKTNMVLNLICDKLWRLTLLNG